ncbi:hypothetical protein B0H34DRAFT_673144 [Crassisporium funariophilum]|nr:hypothetical protein B0H34DRAFT_673144 [Crassisporium funariophilum]
MGKQKWYVVTVGRDIGVFRTWLEVGPLVKGISDALHQSFSTEEEAKRVFAQEMSKGTTKIVVEEGKASSNIRSSHRRNSSSSDSTGAASTPYARIFKNERQPAVPQTHLSSWPTSGRRSPREPSRPELVSANAPPPISRTSSEPSPSSQRRLEIINDVFKKRTPIVGVDTRASSLEHGQVSTSTTEDTGLSSRRANTPSQYPRAIVKTPSWLASYPSSSSGSSSSSREGSPQILSPLNSVGLPLNSFATKHDVETSSEGSCSDRPRSNFPVYSNKRRTASSAQATSPDNTESMTDSPIFLSPHMGHVHVIYEQGADPRSPMIIKTTVPLSSSVSSISFARPSPVHSPRALSNSHLVDANSSLLFKPSPSRSHWQEGLHH